MPDCSVVKHMLTACFSVVSVDISGLAELLHCLVHRHVVRQNMTTYQQLQMMPCYTL